LTWINKHKTKLRFAFLLFLVIAINGPWLAFESMYVPSEPPLIDDMLFKALPDTFYLVPNPISPSSIMRLRFSPSSFIC
jgi:hypothetical protein